MKSMITVAVLLLAVSGVASADHDRGRWYGDHGFRWQDRGWQDHGSVGAASVSDASVSAVAAPEIDPGSIVAGLTLLCGGLAVLRGRRRK
jgi:hypothetical protein